MSILEKFNLREDVLQFIETLGFKQYTPIQEQVIPCVLKGRDVIGISDTGTGKTHAFLIPIFNKIDVTKEKVQAVITAPTRELASQIYDHVRLFMKHEPRLNASLIIFKVTWFIYNYF